MKSRSPMITATLGTAVLGMLFVPAASACAPAKLQGPFAIQQLSPDAQNPLALATSASLARDLSIAAGSSNASIVGMWSFQFLSMGNTTHSPSIPDGAVLDFGYTQWHSDGNEILNSGTRAPATENFCLGTWQKTGRSTYQLSHFALGYDAATGLLNSKTIIVETVTLSPGGTKFSGTLTLTVFDPTGKQVDHLTGQVTAERLTVDTTTP
jgi:hypothetical protein